MDKALFNIWFLRHRAHQNNVLLPGEREKAVKAGTVFRNTLMMADGDHFAFASSPQSRCVATLTAFMEGMGTGGEITTKGSLGDFALDPFITPEDVAFFKTEALKADLSLEEFFLTSEICASHCRRRGMRAAAFVMNRLVPNAIKAGKTDLVVCSHGGSVLEKTIEMIAGGPTSYMIAPGGLVYVAIQPKNGLVECIRYMKDLGA